MSNQKTTKARIQEFKKELEVLCPKTVGQGVDEVFKFLVDFDINRNTNVFDLNRRFVELVRQLSCSLLQLEQMKIKWEIENNQIYAQKYFEWKKKVIDGKSPSDKAIELQIEMDEEYIEKILRVKQIQSDMRYTQNCIDLINHQQKFLVALLGKL